MFNQFVEKLEREFQNELPGFAAQKPMAPLGSESYLNYVDSKVPPKKGAVLILLYPDETTFLPKVVLILRPENEKGNHAGQIAFPGGGVESDDRDFSETALREAEEEIGIKKTSVSILGQLSTLYIPVSNYLVHPYVGFVGNPPQYNIQPSEVQEIIECSLFDLFKDSNKGTVNKFVKIQNKNMNVPCYNICGRTIWGATAMMIMELEAMIKKIM